MKIEDLKRDIENKTLDTKLIIFKYEDIPYVPFQYINEIAKQRELKVEYLEEDSQLISTADIFGVKTPLGIRLLKIDKFENSNNKLLDEDNLYIVCKKISKDAEDTLSDRIVSVPKLENWQIKDYVYSQLEGIDTKELDELIDLCKYDIYRLQSEIEKLLIFNEGERKYIFSDFVYDGIFSDLSTYTVFDLSNSIIKKDTKRLLDIYKELDKIDCEPLGLVTILLNNFRNIIKIQLASNPTPESTGLKPNQFWAIKYNCNVYTKDQLLAVFDLLTDTDRRIKTGEITTTILVDYLITHILSY
jgi:DNA polymerase III delta subunit